MGNDAGLLNRLQNRAYFEGLEMLGREMQEANADNEVEDA